MGSSKAATKVAIVAEKALARRLRIALRSLPGCSLLGGWSRLQMLVPSALESPPRVLLLEAEPAERLDLAPAVAALKGDLPETEVLLLCDPDDDRALAALAAGASGILSRKARAPVVRSAVVAVASGGAPLDPVVARRLVEAWREPSGLSREGPVTLSRRQRQVLEAIIAGQRDSDMAASLGMSATTVRRHVTTILQKLDVETRPAAVAAALRRGLV